MVYSSIDYRFFIQNNSCSTNNFLLLNTWHERWTHFPSHPHTGFYLSALCWSDRPADNWHLCSRVGHFFLYDEFPQGTLKNPILKNFRGQNIKIFFFLFWINTIPHYMCSIVGQFFSLWWISTRYTKESHFKKFQGAKY